MLINKIYIEIIDFTAYNSTFCFFWYSMGLDRKIEYPYNANSPQILEYLGTAYYHDNASF